MRLLPNAICVLAAAVPFGGSAIAHHSQAMFDTTQEILLEGTIARFDWVNPHMYLTVSTEGPDGEPALVEGEGVGITQALVDGLERDALQPGMSVVVRANPNRGGWGKQVRILDITTEDGEIHPFYAANTRTLRLTPAESLAGRWAPPRQGFGAAMGAMARWPITPEGRDALEEMVADGICDADPVPFIAILDEVREIEVGEDRVIMRFDNTGDVVTRTIHMNAEHPADVEPTLQGHSIGRWEGETLVIDTIAFQPDLSGVARNVPSSSGKHLVERLSLTPDRTRLRYEVTLTDPVYLSAPAVLTQQWDHRPDVEFSPGSEPCDDDVAARYRPHATE
jgi:hypothetical protein